MEEVKFSHLPVIPLRITSDFGPRNTGIAGASTYHKGVDIGGNLQGLETPIMAVAYGVVSNNYWNDYRGWAVIIDNGRFKTLYQHLKEQSPIAKGMIVSGGQRIGTMGNSSNPKVLKIATHLHFELLAAGLQIDPLPYLESVSEGKDLTREETLTLIKEVLSGGGEMPSAALKDEWEKARAAGITDGTNPKGYCTREQAAAMLLRFK